MNEDKTELRLRLLANGYTPLAGKDKTCGIPEWSTVVVTEELITKRWARARATPTTGLRVENGLAVIDLDIDDPIIDRIANCILDAIPELEKEDVPLLVRAGKGRKEAWYVQTDEAFSRIHSRAWLRPGDVPDDGAHRVEIFGGASSRQFGSFGPHTVDDDGVVKVWYRWADRSPADTLKSELPVLTKKQFFAIADIVERELEAAGWQLVPKTTKGENDVSRVYDLTEEMLFDLDTGDRVPLQQLRELAANNDRLRCSAAWLEGPSAKRTDRCLVSVAGNGGVVVYETASGVTHCEASLAPREFGPEINRLAEKLKELDERRRNKVAASDRAVMTATKLLATYAFCPYQQLGVVPLYATSADEAMTLQAFRTMYLPNADVDVGPRGGRQVINPVDIWAGDERRVTVRGTRMRPDKPRPTYEDGEGLWVNTYAPPVHDATGGSPAAAIALIEHLLPDEAERRWFTQWLAHKVRFPFIPGPAVIMVAREFGTGRGTLATVIGRLLGQQYVATLPFHMFAGKSYQSQYDDWGAGTLVACISEAAESSSNAVSSYKEKQDTYTHLKSLVEPRAVEKRYTSKRQHFKAMSFTSFFIATNEVDALPIPANDRRFAVLTNGEPGTAEFWAAINEGLERDANIAAFHEWLAAVDLTGYEPYVAPPRTEGQLLMVEMSKSDIDRGLDAAFEALPGDLYTVETILKLMKDAEIEYGLSYPKPAEQWQSIAKKLIRKRGHRVGVPHGMNWLPKFGAVRLPVYATSSEVKKHWNTRAGLREAVTEIEAVCPSAKGVGDRIIDFEAKRASRRVTNDGDDQKDTR